MRIGAMTLALVLLSTGAAGGQSSFVNWESPQINPIDLTPDGSTLLVVNTADDRLEVYTVAGSSLVRAGVVPVGLDPVSVRARTDTEAWVVNHISDSVSVVDLTTFNVKATIHTGDEPTDVVFAGAPERAFVCVSQLNQVKVYDPASLITPPTVLDIEGEDPRALATDGSRVFVAIFESGNLTTIIDQQTVSSDVNPYPAEPFDDANRNGVWDDAEPFIDENGNGEWDEGESFIDQNGNEMWDPAEGFTDLNGNGEWDDEDPNPPPNSGSGFDPPLNPELPLARPAGLIVKRQPDGAWRDENGEDWSAAVTWDLHDHDVAVVDASTLEATYVTGLMNLNMNLAVSPGGEVLVIGTDAINEVRFEPNLNGIFVRMIGARFTAGAGSEGTTITDLNPHLDYLAATVPQPTRDQSIGDPRGLDWNAAGDRVYVTGLGSNNLVAFDSTLSRVDLVEVGEGPTGVRVNDAQGVVYVLNYFKGSVSIVETAGLTVLEEVSFFDPTPAEIQAGRPFLYDTHRTSGLGQASCGSCHVSARMDQIGWDLGVPGGSMIEFPDEFICNFGFGGCEDWHPVKGPLMTQTFIGMSGTEPFHWRGDRGDLIDFNVAFTDLLGDDAELNILELLQFQDFVDSLTNPPNPFRNIDGSLKDEDLANGGNPVTGAGLFTDIPFDAGVTCVGCHPMPTGTDGNFASGLLLESPLTLKNPQLRTLYEKTGFEKSSLESNRGFGFTHDGSRESITEFLTTPIFTFPPGGLGEQMRTDLEAFLLSFGTDTHAGVGVQATIVGAGSNAGEQGVLRDEMLAIADTQGDAVSVIAKGLVNGELRGYAYQGGGLFQSDRFDEVVTTLDLDLAAEPGAEITFTIVPAGTEIRAGIDRDEDGFYDRDELDHCSSPIDPASTPGDVEASCCSTVCDAEPLCCTLGWDEDCMALADAMCTSCPSDLDGDHSVGVTDLAILILGWGDCPDPPVTCDGDVDDNGTVNVEDLSLLLLAWGPCP